MVFIKEGRNNFIFRFFYFILGKKILLWAHLPRAEKDTEVVNSEDEYEQCCR